MAGNSRKQRGAETQKLVAEHLRDNGWPWATDIGAGRNGSDILNTPGLKIEVKARRDLDLTGFLKQASSAPGLGVSCVVVRPDGYGPAKIGDWPVILRFEDWITLLRQAGFGDPFPEGQQVHEEG
jgi:hypothetical protein